MNRLFSLDSKLMRILNIVADYAILNVFFLITSIPLFTIGASKAALYRVMFDMLEGEDSKMYTRYFKTFAREFKAATPLFLLKGLVLALIAYSLFLATHNEIPFKQATVIALVVVLAVWAMLFTTLFIQVSLFSSTFAQYFKNCIYILLTHPIKSLITAVMDVIPLVLLLQPDIMGMLGPVWLFFYFSVTANVSARVWKKPFDGYLEQAQAE